MIKNCIFRNNGGHLAGALYLFSKAPGNKNIVEDCLFEDNRAVPGANTTAARGGALYSFKANYEVKNSIFRKNAASTSGGHVHNADSTLYLYTDCRFEAGTATFGAGTANYTAGTVGTYENCVFAGNTAATSGGAVSTAFTANTTLQNCTVESNTARSGGGLFVQNTNSRLNILNSSIFGNNAELSGGGISISAGAPLLVENSVIEINSADTGGAIAYSDDTANVGSLIVRNTAIQNNFANTQAAGINISNTNTELTNCLFYTNQNFGAGAGGAICNNAAGATSPVTATNCTFADNTATIGGGIAQWEDSTGTATLTLQNCILFGNFEVDYEIEDGTPTVTSLGGNLSGDQSLATVLVATNDQVGVDPLFLDPAGSFDYRLQANSPCIDKGIAAGAPTTDLDGNPRIGVPDQGCFEFQTIGTRRLNASVLPLRLMPNPAVDRSILVLESDWAGQVQIMVVAQNGAQVRTFTAYKTSGRWAQPIDVHDLPAGIYSVRVAAGTEVYEGGLVKR
ncbi:MAG: hypothetical protein IPM98_02200 [Lewinellaceae bacterium]|nr:hypothetical protein [Lewinellaceae bacterium]